MTTLDRTQAPPFQLSSDYTIARPEIFLFPGGKNLYAFRGLQQDVVKLELIFDAGKWFEPALGISHFSAQMLPKGTRQKNSFQIAEELDTLGAHLEINPGYDTVSLSLYSLRKNLLASMRIVAELLREPSFDGDELRVMKEIFVQSLKVSNEKTSVIATKEIRRAVFGNDHPYGTSVEEGDVVRIEPGILDHFFNHLFSLHSAVLVGRLSDSEVQEVIKIIPTRKEERPPDLIFTSHSGKSKVIQKPGSVQASIRLGKKCMAKSDARAYFDAVMFNHVLGGFFGSRLMKNIREEKGLTYGIYSSMHHFLHDSFWVIAAEVNQQNTVRAIEEIRHEIRLLQEEPMPAAELEIARNYFIGSWQSENSTLFSVADKFKSLYLWGLSDDFYPNLLGRIQDITPVDIQVAANSHFGSADLLEIQVG